MLKPSTPNRFLLYATALGAALLASTNTPAATVDLKDLTLSNPTPYITAQCYTKTEDGRGGVHNPCYSCHAQGTTPNYIDGRGLQLEYAFPHAATRNPYTNLFEDRTARIAAIDDGQILDYVRRDNYRTADGTLILAEKLRHLPAGWDLDGDGRWDGYIPDAWFDFDELGFDHAPDGSYTGWRAFAYYPFLGTFWPTNGSTDDVLIRLAQPFWTRADGTPDLATYRVNLAIVEAVVKQASVPTEAVDETAFGVDLDGDGNLGVAQRITFDWDPRAGRTMSYVGKARELQQSGELHLAGGLFPEGTEFLHSVRYLDPTDGGGIALSPRMKELRYARKRAWRNYSELWGVATLEATERRLDADATKALIGDFERGMGTQGWLYQGFIEDAAGELRPQSQEETFFCMGCHGGLSATTDTVFSFPRKFADRDAWRSGWYHWSQKGITGIPEPRRADGSYEYSRYLTTNGAGDEFRANQEVIARFFNADGTANESALDALHGDISLLLVPSRERALQLDKAYRVIVEDQDFVLGRDATVGTVSNVHEEVTQGQASGISEATMR
ncbi:hypothetical protein [Endothiovibrio diazotrophicus]